MLILSRTTDEEILIDFRHMTAADLAELQAEPIRIMVVSTQPKDCKVRLGVKAPRFVVVDRHETHALRNAEVPL